MIISISAFGEAQLSREILRVSKHAADLAPAIEAVYEAFLESEKKLFDSEGASGGTPWQKLAESTVKAKAAKNLDPRILHATLSLRDSLTDRNDPNADFTVTPEGATMGSLVSYGVYHQSTQPRKHLPRRPPVVLTEEDKIAWLKIIQRWIMTGTI